ncbi:hypothetical protein GGI20_001965 [Coemansia sp. BCRC 34301]|nr:hypothetical protein GGI20_001965 [Coemansia sp. BCRC 34301]
MDRDGGGSSHSQNNPAVYPEVLPGGFINPFSVPPAGAEQGAYTDAAAVPQPVVSSPTSIQQLTASLQAQQLRNLQQQQQHRVLHRQSFDISMLPQQQQQPLLPSQPSGLQFQNWPSNMPFRSEVLGMPPQQRQGGFGMDAAFPHMTSALQSGGTMPATTDGLSHTGSASASVSVNSPSQIQSKSSTASGITSTGPPDIALLLSGAAQLKTHTAGKPPYSYATLITYAILHHPRKQMTLNEIYNWAMDNYPHFKTAGSGWKNSVRHNLSLNKTFVRIPRPANEPGKGAYWTVDLAVLDATMNNIGKPPPMHRYSLPRDGRLDALGGMPMPVHMHMSGGGNSGGGGPAFIPSLQPQLPVQSQQPPLGFTSPGLRQSEQAPINPFLTSVTSSISDMGATHQLPPNHSALALRRASLQVLPSSRYQPYPAGLVGATGGRTTPMSNGMAGAPATFIASNPLSGLNPFAVPTTTAPSVAASSLQPLEAFSQTEHSTPTQPPPFPSSANGFTSGSSSSVNNSQNTDLTQPAAPTPADIIGTSARDSGYTDLNESMLMSLKARLQVKSSSSLPAHMLTPQQADSPGDGTAVHKHLSESLEDVGVANNDDSLPATASQLAATAAGIREHAQHFDNGGPTSSNSAISEQESIGDISTFITFSDAHEPPT